MTNADKAPYVKPRLLDLFCGAGGAAVGYARAGFEVVGVDIKPQPHYPFDFVLADALQVLGYAEEPGTGFDAIHASPPCQGYMTGGTHWPAPRLIEPVRRLLEPTGLPYVIENVPGATLRADFVLCGSMFGLGIKRHRWFEVNWPHSPWTFACDHSRKITGVYGRPHGKAGAWPGMLPSNKATWSREMDVDWMTTDELTQAIPPAYTEYIGGQLLALVAA